MVEKIDKVKTEAGKLIRVKNTDKLKLTNAKDIYYCIWVEDSDGGNERALLLVQSELDRILERTSKNKDDVLTSDSSVKLEDVSIKHGRFIHVYNTKKKHWKEPDYYNAVLVENTDGETITLLITDGEIVRFEHRADRNPEDIPSKSFLTDLFD